MSSGASQVRDGSPRTLASAQAQDVPPGYKQTELGTLPSDWTVKSLGAVLTRGRLGGNYPNSELETDFPLMKMGNVGRGSFDLTKVEFVTPGIRPQDEHRLRWGDVLFNTRNTLDLVGKVAIWREELPIAFYNSNLMRFEFDPEQVFSTAYANFALNASGSIERLRGLATGTTSVAAIYTRDLVKLPMIVPSLAEQRAIAEALSDVDGLLGALEALISKKRAIKQAAMQQLLTGKTRLPGFTKNWEPMRLGRCGSTYGGITGKGKADFGHGTARYVTFLNVLENAIVNPALFEAVDIGSAETQNRVRSGDLLFNGTSETPEDVALGACVLDEWDHLYLNSFCFGFRFHSGTDHDPLYFAYFFRGPTGRRLMSALAQGATRYNMSKAQFLRLECPLPDGDEQRAIAEVLFDMDAEVAALEARRDKTRAIKQGMMQQLLTGRIRLVKPSVGANDKVTEQAGRRKPNVHFIRSVLAAEIIDRLHEHPTFGHVKFEKMMFLVEQLCEIETGSTYLRKAAGPYDNRALRSIDSQIREQQWFDARKDGNRYQYVPMQKRGGHKKYFDRYFPGISETFDAILEAFETLDTERCEIVATLLAAWKDLLRSGASVSDGLIVHEVMNNWHESKRRIPEDRWLKALDWMRSKGFIPKGAT